MNSQPKTEAATRECLTQVEEQIRGRLTGRVRDFQLLVGDRGLILRGLAHTWYAKQLAQHAVMESSNQPIQANEIEVN